MVVPSFLEKLMGGINFEDANTLLIAIQNLTEAFQSVDDQRIVDKAQFLKDVTLLSEAYERLATNVMDIEEEMTESLKWHALVDILCDVQAKAFGIDELFLKKCNLRWKELDLVSTDEE